MVIKLISYGEMRNVIFDDNFADIILSKKWYICGEYAITKEIIDGTLHSKYMHRFILGNTHEIVHHINGNTLDNRIENLIGMSRAEHSKMHATKYWIEIKESQKRYIMSQNERWKNGIV